MSKHNHTHAVSNETVYNNYYDTSNVVTRNSLLNILLSRSEQGDDEAKIHHDAILIAKQTNTKPENTVMFNHQELLFIATHAMIPFTITDIVTVKEETDGNYIFDLDGEEYTYDIFDCITDDDGHISNVTPNMLVNAILEHDPEFKLVNNIINKTFEPLLDISGLTAAEYVKEVIKIHEYIKTCDDVTMLPLSECDCDFVKNTLHLLDELYDAGEPKRVMSNSIDTRHLNLDVLNNHTLDIHTSIHGGLSIDYSSIKGSTLLVHRRKLKDDYVLKNHTGKLYSIVSDWDEEEVEVSLIVAMNLMSICSAINTSYKLGIEQQEVINRRGSYHLVVHDKTSVQSMMATAIMVQRMHSLNNFKYQFMDITDINESTVFSDLNVCFVGAILDHQKMWTIINKAKDVIIVMNGVHMDMLGFMGRPHNLKVISHGSASIVSTAWTYMIGKPLPFTIKLFNPETDDYLMSYIERALLNVEGELQLKHVVPLVDDIIKTFSAPDKNFPDSLVKWIDEGRILATVEDDVLDVNVTDCRIINQQG